jgi:hypothetical protein
VAVATVRRLPEAGLPKASARSPAELRRLDSAVELEPEPVPQL